MEIKKREREWKKRAKQEEKQRRRAERKQQRQDFVVSTEPEPILKHTAQDAERS